MSSMIAKADDPRGPTPNQGKTSHLSMLSTPHLRVQEQSAHASLKQTLACCRNDSPVPHLIDQQPPVSLTPDLVHRAILLQATPSILK